VTDLLGSSFLVTEMDDKESMCTTIHRLCKEYNFIWGELDPCLCMIPSCVEWSMQAWKPSLDLMKVSMDKAILILQQGYQLQQHQLTQRPQGVATMMHVGEIETYIDALACVDGLTKRGLHLGPADSEHDDYEDDDDDDDDKAMEAKPNAKKAPDQAAENRKRKDRTTEEDVAAGDDVTIVCGDKQEGCFKITKTDDQVLQQIASRMAEERLEDANKAFKLYMDGMRGTLSINPLGAREYRSLGESFMRSQTGLEMARLHTS
jgi:hypothetical protein